MPHIHQVPIGEATGLLRKLFDAALERAGRVWNIVHVMSLNPLPAAEYFRRLDADARFRGGQTHT